MARHNDTGKFGEQLAESYLSAQGFTILHVNWRYSHFEIDIIAVQQEVLHFIEVKTRRTNTFGFPEESVSKNKIRYLMNGAEEYLYQNPQWNRIQYDVLSINLKNDMPEFFLIEDVYI